MIAAGWDCHVHVFDGSAPSAQSHYRPVPRTLEEIEQLADAHGCGHVVLVQPSVYGTDNTLMLDALRAGGDRHRGVVVLRGDETDEALDAMHACGVRGIRFNLVSPVGSTLDDVPGLLERLAPTLRRLGWHVQWYAAPGQLAPIAEWQGARGLTFVLDHLAGMTPAHVEDAASWEALQTLAAGGAWVKLSGWYRLQAQAPYEALDPVIRRMAQVFAERMVWASDWPHTSFPPDALPAYASLWEPVARALGRERAEGAKKAGARLYA